MRISDWSSDVCSSDPNYVRLVPRAEARKKGWAPRDQARGEIGGAEGAGDPQAHTPYAIDVNAGWRLPLTGMLCKQPPYGWIRAIDMRTGKTIWDRPFGTARTNGPFGIPSMLPITIGTPNNGGSVRSEEHTSELQSLMRTSYAVFCLKK